MAHVKWPRCGFRFITWDTPDTKTNRICVRAWGHWMQPMPKGRHMGPVIPPGRVPRRVDWLWDRTETYSRSARTSNGKEKGDSTRL